MERRHFALTMVEGLAKKAQTQVIGKALKFLALLKYQATKPEK
jgi:hypothetical protein